MARSSTAEKTQSQEVATTGQSPVPASMLEKMKTDAGKGVSRAAEDRIIPLIVVLQANSPQVKPRDPKYLAGAAAGDIWMKNSAKREVIKGDDGFEFQPCYFQKVWIEWRPNRGGFVAVHKDCPPDAVEEDIQKDDGSTGKAWVRENGNHVVETRQHFGFADDQPYVVPFSSTGHTVSRTWMDLMNQFVVPGTRDVAPSFSRKYRFTTVDRSNAKGQSWSVFRIVDLGWVSDDEYERGRMLHDSMSRGEKQAAAPEDPDDGSGDTAGDKI